MMQEENISSAVERLSNLLYDKSLEMDRAINYDLNVCFDNDAVESITRDIEKYNTGVYVCSKYMHGILNLEEFCEEIVQTDLKCFLHMIIKHIPQDIIEKYELSHVHDEEHEEGNIIAIIENLSEQLYAESMKLYHAINYNLKACYDNEDIQRTAKDAERYNAGGDICNKYLRGILNLEEFCEQMVHMDLKHFLKVAYKYLPEGVIDKYHLNYVNVEGVSAIEAKSN